MVDFYVQNEGSIFILYPRTKEAKDWIAEHLPEDAQFWGGGAVIEHRYIYTIVVAIKDDGLSVE